MQIITRAEARDRGLRRYFDGKLCKNGHMTERTTINGRCIQCAREHTARYRLKNPDKARSNYQRWYLANRERELKRANRGNKRRRLANVEIARQREREYGRRRRLAHPEQERQYHLVRNRSRDLQKIRERRRRFRSENLATVRTRDTIYRNRRRASKRAAPNNFTTKDWRVLVARSPRCHWCKRRFNSELRATHDHVVPLSKGGANTLENSCCACAKCNSRKGNMLINPATGQGILL